MFIERYTASIKEVNGKKTKRIKVNANTADEAHKLALEQCNELTQDITKITDFEGNIVYTLDQGFVY